MFIVLRISVFIFSYHQTYTCILFSSLLWLDNMRSTTVLDLVYTLHLNKFIVADSKGEKVYDYILWHVDTREANTWSANETKCRRAESRPCMYFGEAILQQYTECTCMQQCRSCVQRSERVWHAVDSAGTCILCALAGVRGVCSELVIDKITNYSAALRCY